MPAVSKSVARPKTRPRKVNQTVFDRVHGLRRQGRSASFIALQTGLSVWTITNIANARSLNQYFKNVRDTRRKYRWSTKTPRDITVPSPPQVQIPAIPLLEEDILDMQRTVALRKRGRPPLTPAQRAQKAAAGSKGGKARVPKGFSVTNAVNAGRKGGLVSKRGKSKVTIAILHKDLQRVNRVLNSINTTVHTDTRQPITPHRRKFLGIF